jgi:hypothetical protein
MANTVRIVELSDFTSFAIHPEGRDVELGFGSSPERRHILKLAPDTLARLFAAMPGMLEMAIQRVTGNPSTRQVFELSDWSAVPAADGTMTMFTLRGTQGFHVTFIAHASAVERLGLELATVGQMERAANQHTVQ